MSNKTLNRIQSKDGNKYSIEKSIISKKMTANQNVPKKVENVGSKVYELDLEIISHLKRIKENR